MNSAEAISRIKAVEPTIRALGAASMYLFGSTARNEAGPQSDVDVFFDRDPAKPVILIEIAQIQRTLAATLGAPVDVGTRTSLHPRHRRDIEQSAIRIF